MTLSITELRQLTAVLYDHLEAANAGPIEIENDYYWSIPRTQRHDPMNEPTEFTIGQLSDDLMELRRIKDGSAEPIGYALVWLSSVLREIGEGAVG